MWSKQTLSPDRLHLLLDKYQKGQLEDYSEIQELKRLLEARKREKEQAGDLAAVTVIAMILISITFLLSKKREVNRMQQFHQPNATRLTLPTVDGSQQI